MPTSSMETPEDEIFLLGEGKRPSGGKNRCRWTRVHCAHVLFLHFAVILLFVTVVIQDNRVRRLKKGCPSLYCKYKSAKEMGMGNGFYQNANDERKHRLTRLSNMRMFCSMIIFFNTLHTKAPPTTPRMKFGKPYIKVGILSSQQKYIEQVNLTNTGTRNTAISADAASQLPNKTVLLTDSDGAEAIVSFEVFHQLHCLVCQFQNSSD